MITSPLHIVTPTITSQKLQNEFSKSVYFKLESIQPSSSFKIRGIGKLCQKYANEGIKSFVASSGGNAGIAVAYAGKVLNIPVVVFIPSTSHQLYISEIESFGAKVVVAGDVWDEANQAALEFAEKNNAAYIPPFDSPVLWEGHSSIITEVYQQNINVDAIIAAVGGGGLACGILQGMEKVGWQNKPFIAVETLGAESFAKSFEAKKLVTLDKITSRATSLGAKRITPHLLDLALKYNVKSVIVSDEDAEFGARAFAKDKRILVELSAGAALSLVYLNNDSIKEYNSVLVIVCGGVNTSFF
ncbi:MAG: serine dehydratase [Legionellales bacterium RIFCSPHIGHO2_12_FULL_35_11]|nr:MAG: serine dehydratase [Legionellales bacterium RIFCSPHIGHO2_12_FULL_35_11]